MFNTKLSFSAVATAVVAMSLVSCGLPGAFGRSFNRLMDSSIAADESGKAREAMFESLREIHREGDTEGLNSPAADSTR